MCAYLYTLCRLLRWQSLCCYRIVQRYTHSLMCGMYVRYCRKTRASNESDVRKKKLLFSLLFLYCNRFRMRVCVLVCLCVCLCVCVCNVRLCSRWEKKKKKLLTGQLRRTVVQFPHTRYRCISRIILTLAASEPVVGKRGRGEKTDIVCYYYVFRQYWIFFYIIFCFRKAH